MKRMGLTLVLCLPVLVSGCGSAAKSAGDEQEAFRDEIVMEVDGIEIPRRDLEEIQQTGGPRQRQQAMDEYVARKKAEAASGSTAVTE